MRPLIPHLFPKVSVLGTEMTAWDLIGLISAPFFALKHTIRCVCVGKIVVLGSLSDATFSLVALLIFVPTPLCFPA